MKFNLQKSIIFSIILVFVIMYYFSKQYLFSFFSLVLLVLYTRFNDIDKFSATGQGITAYFKKTDNQLKEIINSNRSTKDKIELAQNIIDEVFSLGYKSGGGRFNTISNVKITRDVKGNITGYKFDEN